MKIFAALFFVAVLPAAAQSPEVPHKMEFAGITLTIRDDARREIQKDVDALTQSPRHYAIKVERAKTYFPIIEKIFQEEQVPDDLKYLSLQESALIADAVSVSNAVGFWQFKDFTAIEMGLRVDREIDERLNIVSSSRAAARYLKKNNTFFNNWIYALQAYQMGAGGVLKSVKNSQSGISHMEITSKTYWYVKKFLAHKVAYEPGVKGKGLTEVITYPNSTGKSLSQIAKEIAVDESELLTYNKWTKSGKIPADRTYTVVVPLPGNNKDILSSGVAGVSKPEAGVVVPRTAGVAVKRKINGIQAIQAVTGEKASAFASRTNVDLSDFLKWNDLGTGNQMLVAGNFYLLGKKRVRAEENFHKVVAGENLWSVSQRYGVRIKRLRKYNRLRGNEEVSPGMMLWLSSTRPKSDPVQGSVENALVVDSDETFNWSAAPADKTPLLNIDTLASETVISETVVVEPSTVVMESSAEGKSSDSLKNLQETAILETMPTDAVEEARGETIVVKKTEHTVVAGETLYSIAKSYNVGVMDLVTWNNLDLKQGIRPGQHLKLSDTQIDKETSKIPQNDASSLKVAREVMHEVKSSDTLYSIARQYGVTIKELMDWNEKKDFSLAVGEKLKIHHRQ